MRSVRYGSSGPHLYFNLTKSTLLRLTCCLGSVQCNCSGSSRRKRQREGPCQDEAQQPPRPEEELSSAQYYGAIYNCLMQWCCRLRALQPKCIVTSDVLHRSMDLFRRYQQATQTADPDARSDRVATVHLAACLWIAFKNDGNRACVPSRTLLTRAVAVCPEDLSNAELTVLCLLRWNVYNCQVSLVL